MDIPKQMSEDRIGDQGLPAKRVRVYPRLSGADPECAREPGFR